MLNIKFNVVFVSTILLSINFTSLVPLIANTILSYSHFHKTPVITPRLEKNLFVLHFVASNTIRAMASQWSSSIICQRRSVQICSERDRALVSGDQETCPNNLRDLAIQHNNQGIICILTCCLELILICCTLKAFIKLSKYIPARCR